MSGCLATVARPTNSSTSAISSNARVGEMSRFLIRTNSDLAALETCSANCPDSVGKLLDRIGVSCGEELNKTRQSGRFTRATLSATPWAVTDSAGLLVYEGEHIWQFDDRCGPVPEHLFPSGPNC